MLALASPACADFSDFLVENWGAGQSTLDTVITWGKHDLPGISGPPTGYMKTHSAWWPSQAYPFIIQTFTFGPPFTSFVPARGDGGQLVYYDSAHATAIETRDGGTPANQFFGPGGCGLDGWLLYDANNIPSGRWASRVATLVDVPERSGDCPPPGRAFTRWRIEVAKMFFLWAGVPSWQDVWVILTEHYSHPTIAQSTAMERDYFAYRYGWIRWEGWVTNGSATQDIDLEGRCPGVYIKGGPWPVAEPAIGWTQTACRSFTNILADGDGAKTIGDISWPP